MELEEAHAPRHVRFKSEDSRRPPVHRRAAAVERVEHWLHPRLLVSPASDKSRPRAPAPRRWDLCGDGEQCCAMHLPLGSRPVRLRWCARAVRPPADALALSAARFLYLEARARRLGEFDEV